MSDGEGSFVTSGPAKHFQEVLRDIEGNLASIDPLVGPGEPPPLNRCQAVDWTALRRSIDAFVAAWTAQPVRVTFESSPAQMGKTAAADRIEQLEQSLASANATLEGLLADPSTRQVTEQAIQLQTYREMVAFYTNQNGELERRVAQLKSELGTMTERHKSERALSESLADTIEKLRAELTKAQALALTAEQDAGICALRTAAQRLVNTAQVANLSQVMLAEIKNLDATLMAFPGLPARPEESPDRV